MIAGVVHRCQLFVGNDQICTTDVNSIGLLRHDVLKGKFSELSNRRLLDMFCCSEKSTIGRRDRILMEKNCHALPLLTFARQLEHGQMVMDRMSCVEGTSQREVSVEPYFDAGSLSQ